jgi:hypothetical protein
VFVAVGVSVIKSVFVTAAVGWAIVACGSAACVGIASAPQAVRTIRNIPAIDIIVLIFMDPFCVVAFIVFHFRLLDFLRL